MNKLATLVNVLPWVDWLALAVFFAAWAGYARFARMRAASTPSLLATTNRFRREWMLAVTYRDNRVLDGVVVQNLSVSPSFFASTTLLIIGGLLAALGAPESAGDLVREIPFAARTSALVLDLKIVLLMAIFIYAFFRFTWSLRQYSFAILMVGAAPDREAFVGEAERAAFAERAGRVAGLAAETFNDGLRAYYMSFAAIAWFFSPVAWMVATAGVIVVPFRREFHSDVLAVLND